MNTYALDWESYYDKECSIKVLGNLGYFSHPRFDAYMLSVVGSDGTRWVGHPTEFDWNLLKGAQVLSHNAFFDESLYLYGVEQGWYPEVDYVAWDCTMDLCAYMGFPRSLKNAVKYLFNHELSKETRDSMKDRKWADMTPEFRAEVTEYAIKDAEWCLAIWEKNGADWPEWERRMSRQTREMCRRGIPVDEEKIRGYIDHLTALKFQMEEEVPWSDTEKLKSRKAFDQQCRVSGLTPPKSLAKSNPEAVAWFEKHEPLHPWLAAYRDVSRVGTLLLKYKTIERQTFNGRFYPTINYAGAVTRRFTSGGGGVNMQNLSKGVLFGTNMRSCFRARPGYKFVVADLSQIEIRTVMWLAGAKRVLAEIAQTDDVYEALAIIFEVWQRGAPNFKTDGYAVRQGTKTVGLGIQFGASAGKVATVAKIPLAEGERWKKMFLEKFPEVPRLWKRLTNGVLKARASEDRTYVVGLPSGNKLRYRNVRYIGKELVCEVQKGTGFMTVRPWHGLLIENAAQAMARDIICDAILRIEDAGWRLAWHVHDEVIIEVPEADAQRCLDEVEAIMKTPPTWVSDIPLDCDIHICDFYTK